MHFRTWLAENLPRGYRRKSVLDGDVTVYQMPSEIRAFLDKLNVSTRGGLSPMTQRVCYDKPRALRLKADKIGSVHSRGVPVVRLSMSYLQFVSVSATGWRTYTFSEMGIRYVTISVASVAGESMGYNTRVVFTKYVLNMYGDWVYYGSDMSIKGTD